MNPLRRRHRFLACAVLPMLLLAGCGGDAPSPAAAGTDAPPEAADTATPAIGSDEAAPCIVGRWEPIGNAAADWMRENAPGVEVAVRDQQGAVEYLADGRYLAHATAEVSATAGDVRAATTDARFQAAGAWSIEDDQLVLHPSAESVSGRMETTGAGGARIQTALPSGPASEQRMAFACAGDELETRLPVPGASSIVQRYRRLR